MTFTSNPILYQFKVPYYCPFYNFLLTLFFLFNYPFITYINLFARLYHNIFGAASEVNWVRHVSGPRQVQW